MFYSVIQKGLDKWNAAFFCGSAAVLRRSALEEAGGFAGTSITEDCETALELHSSGWKSLYVDKALIAGLQPETFASFIGQRTRWCTGMMQIFLMKNPAFKKGLTLAQRVCYLATCMFWLFPIPRMIFTAAPLLFIFFDLKIYNATVGEFGAYTLTYLAAAVLMQSYAYGRVRWPWVSELYEYVQSVYLFPAIIGVIRNPRRPTFNVTAKGGSTEDDYLSGLAWPYFAIFGVLLAAGVMVLYRLGNEPDAAGLLGIVGLWNLFNLILAGLALGVVCERRERRQNHRIPAEGRGMLQVEDTILAVQILDVSQGGMLVKAHGAGQVRLQTSGMLAVPSADGAAGYQYIPATVASVRNGDDDRMIGLRFASMGAAEYGYIAGLMYGDLSVLRRIREARQNGRSIVLATVEVLSWGLKHTARGLYFALFRRPGSGMGTASRH
jgi:cellulose synthase (UDP-forming)